MNIKYLLATLLIFFLLSCTPMPMYAQWVVTDPGSVSQRMTLFLEELSEAMQERYSIEKQTDNTFELLKQNKETLSKLQNISNYVKTALVVKEIAEESNNVINKVKNISDKFSKLDRLTQEEIYNFLNFSVAFNEQVYDKFQESKKMSSTNTSSGEMTDYERLQILENIKDEIVKIKKNLSSVESRFKKKNSYEEFSKQARVYTREALFMAFENKYDTEGIKKEKKSSKNSAKESNKKSSTKSKK
jgi:hypothetical protein